jgi:arabinogalactan endo-1,4-beta-galactosidase
VKSKLVLDIKDSSEKEGASIIQWENNQGLNQRWYLENQGKDLYLIRSALKPDLFIGVKNNEFKEGVELVTTKNEDFSLWRILGEFDHQ